MHRSEFDIHTQSHSERQREVKNPNTEIGAFLKANASGSPRRAVLQASTLLAHWNGAAVKRMKPFRALNTHTDCE